MSRLPPSFETLEVIAVTNRGMTLAEFQAWDGKSAQLPDFQILHRTYSGMNGHLQLSYCRCADDNLIDRVIAAWSCLSCLEPFGFNVPIVREDGRLTVHLSCAIAADLTSSGGAR